jgi:hypothetical protein
LPQGVSTRILTDMMLMSKERSAGIERLSLFVKGNEGEFNSEKLHAQEVLWRVEERLWSQLEKQHGNQIWKIKEEIFNETERLISHKF